MELEFRQELGKSYIVADSVIDEEEKYLVSMITENDIPGFIKCRQTYDGNCKKLKYDITNMISVKKEQEKLVTQAIMNFLTSFRSIWIRLMPRLVQTISSLTTMEILRQK